MGNIDKHFIEQMIPHHDGAVAMAKLALEKSNRPEIKTLANAIIEGQTKEIQDMRGYKKLVWKKCFKWQYWNDGRRDDVSQRNAYGRARGYGGTSNRD